MDPEKILQIVKDSREGDRYVLTGERLGSPALSALLAYYLGGRLELVTDAAPELREGRVHLGGRLGTKLFGEEGYAGAAQFYPDGGTGAHLDLALDRRDTTLTAGRMFKALEPYSAGGVALRGPVFRLCSDDAPFAAELRETRALQRRYGPLYDAAAYDPGTVRTFSMRAPLALPEGWEWLRDLLPPAAQEARAVVELYHGIPRLFLGVGSPDLVQLGHLKAGVRFETISVLDALADGTGAVRFQPRVLHRLALLVEFDGTRIPTYALLPPSGSDELEVETDTTELSRRALDAFAGLLGGADLKSLVPAGFPDVSAVLLKGMGMTLSLATRAPTRMWLRAGLAEDSHLVLIPDLLEVTGLDVEASARMVEGAAPQAGLTAAGRFRLSQVVVNGDIVGSVSLPDLSFSLGLAPTAWVDLTELARRLLPLPEGIPAVICRTLEVSGSYAERSAAFAVDLELEDGLPLLFLRLQEVSLAFTYQGGSVAESSLRLGGVVRIAERADLLLAAERYSRSGKQGWRFTGSLEVDPADPLRILDLLPAEIRPDPELVSFQLARVALAVDTGEQSLTFTLDTAETRIAFPGIGAATLRGVSVEVQKTDGGWDWKIRSGGSLKLLEFERDGGTKVPLVELTGELVLSGGSTAGIWFQSAGPSSAIRDVPLLIPAGYEGTSQTLLWSSFNVGLDRVGFIREGTAGWRFEIENSLTFNRLPRFLAAFVPRDGLQVRLAIDSAGAEITLKGAVLDVTIPSVKLPGRPGGPELDVGPSRLYVGDLKLTLKRKFGVSAEVRYYLPQKLNEVFGTVDGAPRLGQVFATFDPRNPDGSRYLGLTVKAGMGEKDPYVGLQATSIPLTLLAEEGEWWALDLGRREADGMGRYGRIRLKKSSFDFLPARGAFRLDAAVEIAKDPALPLGLLKALLRERGQAPLADALPERLRIPLREPISFKDEAGNFQPKKLAAFLGFDLDQYPVVREALQRVASYYSALPQDFRAYLEPPAIKRVAGYLELTADGGMEASLEVDPPLRLLFIGPPSPSFMGVTFTRFAFGQLLGGQLFKLRLHTDFDLFDVATLGAALLVPGEWKPWFGDPGRFRRRVMIHDLLVLVFWQAGIPIPVPVFFALLGIDYYGPGNVSASLQAAFPEPQVNLRKLGELLGDLVRFATDPVFPLDTQKTLEPFDLKLTLGPAFLKAGKQGEEIVIGSEQALPLPSAYQLMARVLNAAKFVDVDRTIATVPPTYRFRDVRDLPVIGPLRVDGTWLLCTPSEFAGGLYRQMGIDESRMRLLLALLPPRESGAPIGERDRGMIAFVNGSWTTGFASFAAGVAFAAVSSKRLGLAIRLQGRVAGLFDVDGAATLLVAPPEVPFRLRGEGRTHFWIAGLEVFTGETSTTVEMDRFALEGKFELLPPNSIVYLGTPTPIGGRLTRDTLNIQGAVAGRFLIFEGSGQVTVSSAGISYYLDILGWRSGMTVLREGDVIRVGGDIPLGWLSFGVQTWINPGARTVRLLLRSNTVANLLITELEFFVPFASGVDGITGQYRLFVLPQVNPQPIVDGTARIVGGVFRVDGKFKLFPDWSPVNLTGCVSGRFSALGFHLQGSAKILSFTFGVVVSNVEFTLTAEDAFYWYRASVFVHNGKLYIAGRAWNSWQDLRFYIDDVFPYFHWGNPPGLAAAEPVEPLNGTWAHRLVRFAVMAAWYDEQVRAGMTALPIPDADAIGELYRWTLLPPNGEWPSVVFRAEDRATGEGMLAELNARRAELYPGEPEPELRGATITLEVVPRGARAWAHFDIVLPDGRSFTGHVLPELVDTAYDRLAAAFVGV